MITSVPLVFLELAKASLVSAVSDSVIKVNRIVRYFPYCAIRDLDDVLFVCASSQ